MTLPWVHDSQPLTRLCFTGFGGTFFIFLVRYELVVIGARMANISMFFSSKSCLTFLSVCFKENSISSWAYLALLVFYCLSVWLTGHRSNYIWKVLFYFFPCRILGKIWCWSWLSCPRLSAFFFFFLLFFCSFSSKSQGYDELQGQMGCFGSNNLFRISRLSFKNESYFFLPCSILDIEFGKSPLHYKMSSTTLLEELLILEWMWML